MQILQGHRFTQLRGPDRRQVASIRRAALRQHSVSARPSQSHNQTTRPDRAARTPTAILFCFILNIPRRSTSYTSSSQPTSTPTQSTKPTTNVGAVAGGVVGGVVGLAMVAVLLLLFLRRRHNSRNVDLQEAPIHEIQPFSPGWMLHENGQPRAQSMPKDKGRMQADISSQRNAPGRTQDTAHTFPQANPPSSRIGATQYHPSSTSDSIAVMEIRTLVQEIKTTLRGLHTHIRADEPLSAPPEYMEGLGRRP
jgi:hypothetical protein